MKAYFRLIGCLFIMCLFGSRGAIGYTWQRTTLGDFNYGDGQWLNISSAPFPKGTPGPLDEAVFTVDTAPYTVTISGFTVASVRRDVKTGSGQPVTFDLQGLGYTVNDLFNWTSSILHLKGGKFKAGQIVGSRFIADPGVSISANSAIGQFELDGAALDANTFLGTASLLNESTATISDSMTVQQGLGAIPALAVTGRGSLASVARYLSVTNGGSILVESGGRIDAGTLQVGVLDNFRAALNVQSAGVVECQNIFLGGLPFSDGTANVTGAGSVLNVTGIGALVGDAGSGTLLVEKGGQATIAGLLGVGDAAGGSGKVTVKDANSFLSVPGADFPVVIGNGGLGTLDVELGGRMSADSLLLGKEPKGNGSVVIKEGAVLNLANDIFVGEKGRGSLQLFLGGQLIATRMDSKFSVAESTGSSGNVVIDGAGSRFDHTGGLTIVGHAESGTLTISGGGELLTDVIAIGGTNTASALSTVTVKDAGSHLHVIECLVGGSNRKLPGTPANLVAINSGWVQIDSTMTIKSLGVVRLIGGRITIGFDSRVLPDTLLVGPGGFLSGKGKVLGQVLVARNGTFSPGLNDGTFTIEGDYEQEGELSLTVGGTLADTEYDVLKVTGQAKLGGTLTLNFINGFAPKKGQTFDLLQFGSATGTFAQVRLSGLVPGFEYEMRASADGKLRLVALNDGQSEPLALLLIALAAGQPNISWPDISGFRLQRSSDLKTWQDLATSTNLFRAQGTLQAEFFRLKR